MGAPKLALQPDEKLFLMNNFYKKTNAQLTDHINNFRAPKNQFTISGVCFKCQQLGLSRNIQIRWNKSDIKKLNAWYPIMGDTQISKLLNLYGTSSRKINGIIVKRSFTKKHIEKKRNLLDFYRTKKQTKNIVSDNYICDNNQGFTKKRNLWTINKDKIAKEHEVRIWKGGMWIKINGKFIPYPRWFYKNFIGPVPDNKKVYHIDTDLFNNEPENLRLGDFIPFKKYDYKIALIKIESRIQKETNKVNKKWDTIKNSDQKKELMKELNRLNNILDKLNKKLALKQKHKSKYYEPIEAF